MASKFTTTFQQPHSQGLSRETLGTRLLFQMFPQMSRHPRFLATTFGKKDAAYLRGFVVLLVFIATVALFTLEIVDF